MNDTITIMAPRSEYILPQGFQSIRYNPASNPTKQTCTFTNEDNFSSAISLFQQNVSYDKFIDLEDEIQNDHKDAQKIESGRCLCHNTSVKRSLLPELEIEAVRLESSGPWFTLPSSQYKRSKCHQKILNDPVKKILLMDNDSSAVSVFQHILPNDRLIAIDDEIQNDDKGSQLNDIVRCSCHKAKVNRSLLPELESEAIRLGPSGPWFTKPRSQYKSVSERN